MEDMTFDIYLPVDYHGQLELLTSKGKIKLPALDLKSLTCVSTTGNISTKAITSETMILSSINGKIDATIDRDVSLPVTIDTVSGNVNSIFEHELDTSYKFLTTTGDISLKAK